MNISFCSLTSKFPKDTMWIDGCAEIIGYSPKENLHIVISDGQCMSDDGMYLVHEYKPRNHAEHLATWNKGKYPTKYILNEPKILEERMKFE